MLFHIERGGKKREQRVKGLREHRARGLAIGVKKGKAVIEVFAGEKGAELRTEKKKKSGREIGKDGHGTETVYPRDCSRTAPPI